MTQSATPPTLTPKQIMALESLLSGGSVVDASEASEVDRTTVHRWMRTDSHFLTAFNQGKQALVDATYSRLSNLAMEALQVLLSSVTSGNVELAREVVGGLGLLKGGLPRRGPETVPGLEARKQEEDATRQIWGPLLAG